MPFSAAAVPRSGWRVGAAVLLAVVAPLAGGCARHAAESAPPTLVRAAWAPDLPGSSFPAYVVRVVDGDTFLAKVGGRGTALRVRLIGVDTPETVRPDTPVRCFGPQASQATKRWLTHRWIRAAYEPGGRQDRYGRELWDVWLTDGSFLAADLAAGGFARAYPFPPQTRYAAELRRLADDARAAGTGLWGPPCRGDSFG